MLDSKWLTSFLWVALGLRPHCILFIFMVGGKTLGKSFHWRYTGAKGLFIRTLHLNRDKKLIPVIRLFAAANNLNSLNMFQ